MIHIAFITGHHETSAKKNFADSDGFYRFLENHKPLDSHMWGRHNFMVGLYNDQTGLHFMGGPTLSRLDMKNGEISWNGEWEFRSSVHEDYWEAEFKIPFSDLDIDHTPYGEIWGLALGRTQGGQAEIKADPQVVGKKTDWSGGGNTPATGISSKWDGRILFEKEMELYCAAEKWTQPKPLQNRLGISIENKGKGDATVLVETVLYPFSGVPDFINQVRQENNTSYILPLTETPLIQTTIFTVSANGHKISKEHIDLVLVKYNYIPWQPSYVTQGKDWYPDPLLPLKQGFNLNGKDVCRPVWITCYVPKGNPVGTYQAKVSVSPVNEKRGTSL